MKAYIFLFVAVVTCLSPQASAQNNLKGAGRWFPADPAALDAMVGSFIDKASVAPLPGRIVGALAPHAGYVYSGSTAGFTYRALRENASVWGAPESVVILGPSHRVAFSGTALMDGLEVTSPVGKSHLDRNAGLFLIKECPEVFFSNAYHDGEHSVENQIPFVQKIFPKAGIIAALQGDHRPDRWLSLAECLRSLSKKMKIIVIASSDMYHDPSYDTVSRYDRESLQRIREMDYRNIAAQWSPEKQSFCGIGPVVTLMRFSELLGVRKGDVLHYRNSGDDFPESRGRWVVGYGSAVFAAQ